MKTDNKQAYPESDHTVPFSEVFKYVIIPAIATLLVSNWSCILKLINKLN